MRQDKSRQDKPLRSEMGWSTRDRITVRGFDLTADLLGKIDLGGMAWLEITGRLPEPREAEVFNALLVTLVEHGMTPQAISTRLISICAPEAMQAAVAAGLLGVGSVFAGGSEETARVLQGALAEKPADADLAAIASAVVEDYVARKVPVPGIGHPVHKPIDPRTPVLFAIAEKNGFRGRYVALLEAICATAERRLGRSLPINATGAIGAILSELGFPWRICRGVAIIGRAVGLVGHVAEEMRNPLGHEIYQRIEHEVAQNAAAAQAEK
jgi:citrate synthase